jgi:hypothetical protein
LAISNQDGFNDLGCCFSHTFFAQTCNNPPQYATFESWRVLNLLNQDFIFVRFGDHKIISQLCNRNFKRIQDIIQIADKCIPYEVYVKDLAREIVALQTEALRQPNDIISQRKAYKLFGTGKVRRWVT